MRKRLNNIGEARDISILTLDDDPVMTAALQAYFQNLGYKVEAENEPEAAIDRIRHGSFDILLLDFLMRPICGDQVVARIREFNTDIFIILLTGHKSLAPPIKTIRQLAIQGYYEKSDRFDQLELLVESCVKSIEQMRIIKQQSDKLKESYFEIIRTLRLTVDARDTYTRGHSDRVAYYAERLAAFLGRDDEFCERVRLAGIFHDVGKLNIPDSILLKDSSLTDEEFAIIKTHPVRGYELLSSVQTFAGVADIVRRHHERWDGKGYPDGVSGEDIPEEARMIAIADSFDAMTSNRRYRDRRSLDYAKGEIAAGRGTQFDPRLATAFLELLEDYESMQEELRLIYDDEFEEQTT